MNSLLFFLSPAFKVARFVLLAHVFISGFVSAFQALDGSLAGLTEKEVGEFMAHNRLTSIPPPPGPLATSGLKLVDDPRHPFIPPGPNDMRGPCPGLNTLANHGYLPRTGVARPDQLITAVMEGKYIHKKIQDFDFGPGYNLGNDFAKFLVYQAHLIDGNPLTNLLSIGLKTAQTGNDPPSPAIVGGLSQHDMFEGDTSMTRVDAFFGDSSAFNATRFADFELYSKKFGSGTYDINAAAELRYQRLQDSIQTNPQLSFTSPRILSAYAEAVFPTIFFVDGRLNNGRLCLEAARSFFDTNRFPPDFHRQPAPVSFPTVTPLITQIFNEHPIVPGVNNGTDNFIEKPDTPALSDFCGIYEDIVLRVLKNQYPNPTGSLLTALNTNLDFFFSAVKGHNCTQAFPFQKSPPKKGTPIHSHKLKKLPVAS